MKQVQYFLQSYKILADLVDWHTFDSEDSI